MFMFLRVLFLGLLLNSSSFANSKMADWTLLIFVNGHNNLDDAGFDDLNEMERVGSTPEVNVVVQWASLRNKTTRRLLVQKDNDPVNVTSPVLEELSHVDMGDVESFRSFVEWGIQKFP